MFNDTFPPHITEFTHMLSGASLSCESLFWASWCCWVGLFWLESASGNRGSLSAGAGAGAGAAASWLLLLWKPGLQKATG